MREPAEDKRSAVKAEARELPAILDELHALAQAEPAALASALRRGAQSLLALAATLDQAPAEGLPALALTAGDEALGACPALRGGFSPEALRCHVLVGNALPDVVLILRVPDGHILDANAAAVDAYGYDRDALLGKTAHELRSPDTRDELTAQLAAVDADPGPGLFETVHRRRDGTTFPVEVSSRGARVGGRHILVSVVRDISQRKLAEAALRASERRLTHAVHVARLGIWEWDPVTDTTVWNDEMLRIYGVTREAFTGRRGDYLVFTREDYRAAQQANIQRSLATEVADADLQAGASLGVVPKELCIVRPDGTECYTLGEAIALVDEAHRPSRILGVTYDITERKQAELALRESEERFRAFFAASPLGIAIAREGRTLLVNPSYARLFGFEDPADLVGSPLVEQLAPEVREAILERHRLRLAGNAALDEYETVGLRRDGSTFPFLVNVIALQLPDGPATLSFFRDLTERRLARLEREKVDAQLRHAQRMEAVGTLAGGIAHDFNNLLTPILMHAELALGDLPPQSPTREDVIGVQRAAERAQKLVRQILTISRREDDAALVPMNLAPLLEETVQFLRASLPATIEIRTEVAPGCPPVLGDAGRLHQVLLNLCTNARDAMQERGGVLTLSLEHVAGDEPEPSRAAGDAPPRGFVKLAIRDTGTGISAEVKERIFEPYFTTKPRGKGTGLGLAVVHGIVVALGGELRVESTLGEGTTFELQLPATEPPAPSPQASTAAPPRGRGERILLVDDVEAVRRVMRRVLAGLGYRVRDFSGAALALAAFCEAPDSFDLVLTDQTMPEMTGLELATALQVIRPDLPILLSTGFSEAVSAQTVKAQGLRGLVAKPISAQNLAELLRRVLDDVAPSGRSRAMD